MAKGNQFQFSNVYLISGLATLGGLMQGFDVASMSAIIGTQQVSAELQSGKRQCLTPHVVQDVLQQAR